MNLFKNYPEDDRIGSLSDPMRDSSGILISSRVSKIVMKSVIVAGIISKKDGKRMRGIISG
jgi:hypothetical protein